MTEIKIPYSRTKIGLVFLGAMSFVAIGIFTILSEDGLTSIVYRSEFMNKSMAIIGLIFFGTIAFTVPFFVLKKHPAIIINDKGITDHSNLSSIGLIDWSDIKGIRIEKVEKTSFILIDTDKPEKYIGKAKSSFKRKLLKANNKKYGTPLSIATPIAGVKFKDLEKMILESFKIKNER